MTIKLPTLKQFTLMLLAGIVFIGIIIVLVLSGKKGVTAPIVNLANPPDKAVNVGLYSNPTLIFDKEVLAADITITSTPILTWNVEQITPTTLTLKHSLGFQPQTQYKLQMVWQDIPLPEYTFTSMQSQTDPKLLEDMKSELERDYPLGQSTPYETNLYRVVYSAPLTLEITLTSPNISSEEAISEIRDWVKGHSLDPETHKYAIKQP